MKHLKSLELMENESPQDNLWSKLDNLYSDINMVYSLMDEGYLDHNGNLKGDTSEEDCIDFCERELGIDHLTMEDINNAVNGLKQTLGVS